jgi:hypothetical protein
MELDLDQIKKNYADFDDFKIEYLAKNEINALEPEVVAILKDEIKKRGLDSNLNKGIEAQTRELTDSELIELKSKVSRLTCPECGQKNPPLIGTLIREVKSFIVLTFYKKTPIISCKDCADKRRKKAIISTALLGWWGIPVGLIRTPIVIITSLTDSNKREFQSDSILTNFVIKNVGEIRTNWDNENELVDFVRHINKIN